MRDMRDMYKRPFKWAAFSMEALLKNLEEVCLPRLLRERKNTYLGSFLLDPEDIKS
jgi:hypothetical protein